MRRRRFLAAMSGALAAPLLAARAGPERPFRVGFASNLDPWTRLQFANLLKARGWVHEKDYLLLSSGIVYGLEIEASVRKILAMEPDLVVVASTAYAVAARSRTSTIPIVMYSSGYPVAAGLAHSLGRPGMNVTGSTIFADGRIWGKLFQLLAEAKPGIRRIGLVWSYLPPHFPAAERDLALAELRRDGQALGLHTIIGECPELDSVPQALATIAAARVDAAVLTSGPGVWGAIPSILKYFMAQGWPSVSDATSALVNLDPGPLLAYAPSREDLMRQTADYIDRIMRGAAPADLPIQLPKIYEFVVNRKTALALGLSLPTSLLLRADRVIE
jgi:putative ABC transport system substrate-binding protein